VEAHDNGNYEEAARYYEEGLKLAKKEFGAKSFNYSRALNNYAILCNELGEFEKAETMLLEALEIRKKQLGDKSTEYGFTLNCLGSTYHYMGKYNKAEEFYLASIEIDRIANGENSEEYANGLSNIGLLYQQMGKYENSERCLLKAMSIRKALFGENNAGYIVSLGNLAILYLDLGRYEESEKMFLQVLEANRILLGEEHGDYGTNLINMGAFYSEIGENEKAEAFYLKGMAIWKKAYGEISPGYFSAANNLASLYNDMDEYEKAEQLFLQCKLIGEQLWKEDHPDYGTCLNNLADLYVDMGKNTEAEALYQEAIRIRRSTLGENHPEYGSSLNNLANLWFENDRYEDAESLYIQALRIYIENYGQAHPQVGVILLNLAGLYVTTAQFEKAGDLYLVSGNIIKEGMGEDNLSYATSIFGLAKLYRIMDKFEASDTCFRQASIAFKNILGPESPDYAKVVNGYAVLKSKMGDTQVAGQLFEKSDSILLNYMQKIFRFTSETEKTKYVFTISSYFERAQNYYLSSFSTRPNSTISALNFQLATNGLILSSVASLRERVFSEGGDSAQHVYTSWTRLNTTIINELSKPTADRHSELATWESESNILEKQLNRLSQSFKNTSTIILPDYKTIRQCLKPGEAAIEFVSFNYYNKGWWSDSVVYAAILTRPEDTIPVYIPLFYENQLSGLFTGDSLRTFANLLYTNAQIRGVHHDISYGDSLYQLVWKPISSFIENKTHIYYSPSGLLHRVNFDAIPMSETTLLSDKCKMDRLTTTGRLLEKTKGPFIPGSISLFGGIQYSMDKNDLKKLANDHVEKDQEDHSEFRSLLDSTSRGGFSYLPGSETEVKNIQTTFSKYNIPAILYTGQLGNEEAVKKLNSKNSPSILHFSTHGFFFPEPSRKPDDLKDVLNGQPVFTVSDNPLFRSGLIMAGAEYVWKGNAPIEGVEDGILTAYEVSNLYLPNTKLVVMSACETGLGDIQGSEGVYGLQRAFKMAGVDYIIMTLWQVLDKETSDFMTLFYQNLLAKKSIPDAFKITQDSMKNKYRHEPYKWAGFVLIH
jgi:tetratricopeptide (TPR) repeat protein/CHAT domain-containing protein